MAEDKFPHVKAMLQRQSAPGAIVLLIMALTFFGPRVLDYIRGEPRIANDLMITLSSNQEYVVEDIVSTPGVTTGLRANVVEDASGGIICASSHINNWLGDRKRIWRLSAFANCYATPIVPFRVCSKYTVESDSGRRRDFGPFCSPMVYPEIIPS